MRTTKLALLAALALGAAGCGGHGGTHAGRAAVDASGQAQVQAGGSATVKTGATAAANSGASGAGTSGSLGGGATQTGSRTGSSPAPAGATPSPTGPAAHREVPLDATLSALCVTPGGSETLTIHGEPNWRVVFDTRYADGKDGQAYGGIDYRGGTGTSGTYLMTWTVSVAAPTGDADVEAAAVGDGVTAHKRLPFKIALHCG